MSRFRFLPTVSRQRRAVWPRPGSPSLPVLRLSCAPVPPRAAGLADAVLARVGDAGLPVGTVVLDLSAVSDLGDEECAALRSLHDRLRVAGTRLRVVAGGRPAHDRLRDSGVTGHLGGRSVHPTVRSAVLASYAELPGPGLVTGSVRDALTVLPEPLEPAGGAGAGARVRPERQGRDQAPLPLEPLARPQGPVAALPRLATASPAADGAARTAWLVDCPRPDHT